MGIFRSYKIIIPAFLLLFTMAACAGMGQRLEPPRVKLATIRVEDFNVLETVFACQRTDGWFPRQYSAAGSLGKHDLRKHMDGGVWVIEFLYEYLWL